MNAKAVADGVVVEVHVKPSSKNDIVTISDEITIETKRPPERGKANAAAIRLLADKLDVQPSNISIVRGSMDKHKLFLIRDLTMAKFSEKLKGSGNVH